MYGLLRSGAEAMRSGTFSRCSPRVSLVAIWSLEEDKRIGKEVPNNGHRSWCRSLRSSYYVIRVLIPPTIVLLDHSSDWNRYRQYDYDWVTSRLSQASSTYTSYLFP